MRAKKILLPSSLRNIHYELKRNTFDVILVTKVYTLLLGRNAKVLNLNYREYYDLHVKVSKKNEEEFYVDFEITDWLEKRRPRKLRVSMHQYNLFSDYRMGMYELFYGKEFVRKNREKLLQYSNMKIKQIREQVRRRQLNEDKEKSKKKKLSKYKEKKDGEKSGKDSAAQANQLKKNTGHKKKNKKKKYSYSKYTQSARKDSSSSRNKNNSKSSKNGRRSSLESDSETTQAGSSRAKIGKDFELRGKFDTSTVTATGMIETQNNIKVLGAEVLSQFYLPKVERLKLDLDFGLGKTVMAESKYGMWSDLGVGATVDPLWGNHSVFAKFHVPTIQFYNLKEVGNGLELFEVHPLDFKMQWRGSANLYKREFYLKAWYSMTLAPMFGEGFSSASGRGYGISFGIHIFHDYFISVGVKSSNLELGVLGQSFSVQESTVLMDFTKKF